MAKMNITLRQLKVFSSVAKHLSFTRAAEELHLTQPAVSMQVKQLEGQLETSLFEQLGKKIYLTEAGAEVQYYSRAITQQLDDMATALSNLKGLEHGKLRISVATTANYFAPHLLAAFTRRYPGVNVILDVTNRQTLLHQLAENEVDMVIMGTPPAEMELESEPFMENPLVLIAPPDHHLVGQKGIALKALEQEVFLIREQGSGTRNAMERFFAAHDISITASMEVSSDEAIKQSVQAGLGLGVMSQDAVEMELTLGRLKILDAAEFPIQRHWYLVHRKGKRLSAIAEAFKGFLLDEAAKQLDKPPG
jgi:DNA-binding transcriptional LysR family regulator